MNDTELAALTILVDQETQMMDNTNKDRLRGGYALAYPDYGYYWYLLEAELKKRGKI